MKEIKDIPALRSCSTARITVPVNKVYHCFRYNGRTFDTPQALADYLGMKVKIGSKTYKPK